MKIKTAFLFGKANKKVTLAMWCLLAFVSGPSYAGAIIDIADKPLYATKINAKPTLTVALSVEFPTVGATYRTQTYDQSVEYIGYFNPDLCYSYNNASQADQRYFTPNSQPSVNHGCAGNGFSGNFLNWASSSSIDILRYSLTGGDRAIDTPTTTVLQRAFMRRDYYHNNTHSPEKILTAAQLAQAVPSQFRTLIGGTTHNGDIYINSCLNRVYFHTLSTYSSNCDINSNARLGSVLSSDPFFYVRVEVCTRNADGSLQDMRQVSGDGTQLCARFPSGYYKPVGKLYAYADEIRVAVFGYPYKSGDGGHYKAVLRAPMKFVGPNNYDSDYVYSGLNAAREWDTQTGVFYEDPENVGAPFNLSGAINQINRFGRTSSNPGLYISHDTVNYLYYEALRYLQGLQPSPQALKPAVVNSGTYDGFPIYTTWQDPHPPITGLGSTGDYSCYANNILTIGDRYDNSQWGQVPGFPGRSSLGEHFNEPNFRHWTNIAGGFEANANRAYVDGAGATRQTAGNPTPYTQKSNMAYEAAGAGNRSDYSMTGMAYWAHTHDIRGQQWEQWANASGSGDPRRPGMRVTSYFIDVNEASGSTKRSDRLGLNIYHYAAKYGGFDVARSLGDNPFTSDGTTFNNALWQRGIGTNIEDESFPNTYFLASDAHSIMRAFDDIFSTIVSSSYALAPTGNSSGYSNSISVGDIMFQGRFNGMAWTGDVTASTVTLTVTDGVKGATFPAITSWSPADTLNNRNIVTDPRNIIVGQRSNTGTYNGKPFTWSNLQSTQQIAIDAGTGNGSTVVDFLRGDQTVESEHIRARSGRLGDIVNSGVTYKAAPSSIAYDSDYYSFFETYKNRTPMVYVGANDGMLHAFSADMGATGQDRAREVFAYIPSFLVDNLHLLAEPIYAHHSYVDATPVVAEAKIAGNWRTVLVGGAGGGGQGVYALDVTDPVSFNENSVLWEFTDQDDAMLGNVLGTPKIVRIAIRANENAIAEYKWYAVVASGVNNQLADGHAANPSQGSALFILDLSKPAGAAWSHGVNYFRIELSNPTGSRASNATLGLIDLTAVVDNRNRLQTIYAGDLSGQLWRVRFGNTGIILNQGLSGLKLPSAFKLFMTESANQQITAAPAVVMYGDKTILNFGTGIYLSEDDTKPPYHVQSLYTILDADEFVDLDVLAQARIKPNNTFGVDTPFTLASPTVARSQGSSVRSGWFVNLPFSASRGERMIYQSLVTSGIIIANTIMPSAGGCDLGNSRQYRMDLLNGSGNAIDVGERLLGSIVIVNLGSSISIDPDTGSPMIGAESQPGGPTDQGPYSIDQPPMNTNTAKGILDWREISSFNQLRNVYIHSEGGDI